VHLYEALADATDDALAKAVLQDIADEERVHAGEFQRVLNMLLPDEEKWLAEGAGEVNEIAEKLEKSAQEPSGESGGEIPTVGDMKA
jgi:rubrerythrin